MVAKIVSQVQEHSQGPTVSRHIQTAHMAVGHRLHAASQPCTWLNCCVVLSCTYTCSQFKTWGLLVCVLHYQRLLMQAWTWLVIAISKDGIVPFWTLAHFFLDVSEHVADHKTQKGMLCPDLLALRVNHSHSAHRHDIALPGASQLLFYSSNKNRGSGIWSLDTSNIHKCWNGNGLGNHKKAVQLSWL